MISPDKNSTYGSWKPLAVVDEQSPRIVLFCKGADVTKGVKFICSSSKTGLTPLSEIQPETTRKQKIMKKKLGFSMSSPQFAVFRTTLPGLEDRSTLNPNGVIALAESYIAT
jgi:hypothetical protein